MTPSQKLGFKIEFICWKTELRKKCHHISIAMDFSLGFIEFDRSLFCYLFDITQYNNFSCIEWTMFSIQQKTFCSTVHQIDIGIWRGNNKISILTFFFVSTSMSLFYKNWSWMFAVRMLKNGQSTDMNSITYACCKQKRKKQWTVHFIEWVLFTCLFCSQFQSHAFFLYQMQPHSFYFVFLTVFLFYVCIDVNLIIIWNFPNHLPLITFIL